MKSVGQGAFSTDDARAGVALRVTVPASAEACSALRRAVRALEAFFGAERAGEVELLVTELATNGVKHVSGDGDNRITLDARIEDGRLLVTVSDRGPGFTPRPRSPDRSEPGGWGLMLVGALADRWGVEREPTRVWFELGRGHGQLAA